jgi:UDP-2,3-diacylglucosamine hydrolase
MASTRREMREEALELGPGSLVLADLHLHPEDEPRLDALVHWMDELAGVPRLVILGDLFDVWVGPAQARQRASGRVVQALASLSARGTAVEIVPGNRDFLLDSVFEQQSGARLWPAGVLARAPGGSRILMLHGDELCTRDLAYQRMKRVLRSPLVRALSRRSPLRLARWAAARLRARSVQAVAQKLPEEKAMQADAVRQLASARGADTVICGHAHRFRDEALAGGPRWIVLDAWGGERDLLVVSEGAPGAFRVATWSPMPGSRQP